MGYGFAFAYFVSLAVRSFFYGFLVVLVGLIILGLRKGNFSWIRKVKAKIFFATLLLSVCFGQYLSRVTDLDNGTRELKKVLYDTHLMVWPEKINYIEILNAEVKVPNDRLEPIYHVTLLVNAKRAGNYVIPNTNFGNNDGRYALHEGQQKIEFLQRDLNILDTNHFSLRILYEATLREVYGDNYIIPQDIKFYGLDIKPNLDDKQKFVVIEGEIAINKLISE